MKDKYSILLKLIVGILFIANINCNSKKQKNKNEFKEKNVSKIKIMLQPLGKIETKIVFQIFEKIKIIHPNIELLNNKELPSLAYYPLRKRYRADTLISWLSRKANINEVIVGITNEDISTSKKEQNIDDWGVMGLGFCPGNACIASNYRLKDKSSNSFFKVVIHEYGHTQGLNHCENKECYMRDAKGGDYTNEEKDFCKKCSNYLKGKGEGY